MMTYMVFAVSLLAAISFNVSFADAAPLIDAEKCQTSKPHEWLPEDSANFGNFTLDHRGYKLSAYAAAYRPDHIANVVFLHGFADTAKNHRHLFRALKDKGFRVFSFDYPEHGGSKNLSINLWNMDYLAGVIPSLLGAPGLKTKTDVPLILMGWSTGGTLALRTAQSRALLGKYSAQLKGVAAIAPGVPVNSGFAAAKGIVVSNEKLTNCPAGMQDPTPKSPLFGGLFTASLISTSKDVARKAMPADVRTLVFFAKDDDEFVNTKEGRVWATSKPHPEGKFHAYHCEEGNHGLEFDHGTGDEVREHLVNFALAVKADKTYAPQQDAELPFCYKLK